MTNTKILTKDEFAESVMDDIRTTYYAEDELAALELVHFDPETHTVGEGVSLGLAIRHVHDNHTSVIDMDEQYNYYVNDLQSDHPTNFGILVDYMIDGYRDGHGVFVTDIDQERMDEENFFQAVIDELKQAALPRKFKTAERVHYDPADGSISDSVGVGLALQMEGDAMITLVHADDWYAEYCRPDRVPDIDEFVLKAHKAYAEANGLRRTHTHRHH